MLEFIQQKFIFKNFRIFLRKKQLSLKLSLTFFNVPVFGTSLGQCKAQFFKFDGVWYFFLVLVIGRGLVRAFK